MPEYVNFPESAPSRHAEKLDPEASVEIGDMFGTHILSGGAGRRRGSISAIEILLDR